MKKFLYIFATSLIVMVVFLSYQIISGQYDKQNVFIIKMKEIVPKSFKNNIKNLTYELRRILNEDKDEKLQKTKFNQGLNGELIQSKIFKTNKSSTKYSVREFFLPFNRLDLNYGWKSILNAKRAHYFDTFQDRIIAVSGEGDFIYFATKNFNSDKLNQTKIQSNLNQFLETNKLTFIGLRDLLIDNNKVYISVILKDKNEKYTMSILSSELNFKNLKFDIFFETSLNLPEYSIGSGGRIVNYKNNEILFSVGHFDLIDEIQDPGHIAGKIISINKISKQKKLISLGHRNAQGLFYFKDEQNEYIINSEHGPKGGDEVNISSLNINRIHNFGWPISSYGVNYDGTNPYKPSHKDYGYDEPFVNFTPSIGISEISVINKSNLNIIYASSLRAQSIYIIEANKKFTKVLNKDRLKLDYRIRDIKFIKSLGGFVVIFENIPSIGFIKKT